MSSERLLHRTPSPWWAEHVHRYNEVIPHLKPTNKVLDLACGTGYGSALLAAHAAEVIGGDVDAGAIQAIDPSFVNLPGLRFSVMDGTRLPFADQYFDVVVSFETIEHTTSYRKMISEFRRVLKPEGLFFVSTPNRLVQSPDGIVHNPYHTQEFTPEEFKALLEEQFSSVRLFGQEYIRYKYVNGFRWKLGQMLENMQYRRGIRKLPIAFQDTLLRLFIGKPQYPEVQDYTMNDDLLVLSKNCVTQFAICKP